jgi:L-fucose isomerase-like protein
MEKVQDDFYTPVVAILTFTDARNEGISSDTVEKHLRKKQLELKHFLENNSIRVVDPLPEIRDSHSPWYGIRNLSEIDAIISILSCKKIDAVIIGSWTWAPPMFIKEFIRKFPKPLLYYSQNDPFSGSLSQLTATCSSLLDWSVNDHALKHQRIFGDPTEMLPWIHSVTAIARMKESALMLWGGTYAVKMDQLQDDYTLLKSFMVREILMEDQYVLIKRAEEIRKNSPRRCKDFWDWCISNGLKITRDSKMVTNEALEKQAALLLAARDRMEQLADENIRGVSIKCQPEIYSEYGVNACTLPGFLPFPANEHGEQRIYPTVCEGDTKGLLTSMLLHFLRPHIPPIFGDLVSVDDDHIEFANCGAGSLFWAGNTSAGNTSVPDNADNASSKAFANIEATANIHGNSGAAFNYFGQKADQVTIARLTRINGSYIMQAGVGEALDARSFLKKRMGDTEPEHLAGTWGKVVVRLGVRGSNFIKVIGANHIHATIGNVVDEIALACEQWNIPLLRLDSDEDMIQFYHKIRGGVKPWE